MTLFDKKMYRVFPRPTLFIGGLGTLLSVSWWSSAAPAVAQDRPPTPVVVAAIQERVLGDQFNVVGTVHPRRFSNVASESEGRVAARYRDTGQEVGRGEALILLDNPRYEAALLEALADEKLRNFNLERANALFHDEAASEQALREAEYECDRAKSKLKDYNSRLRALTVRSPFDGQVVQVLVELGEWVNSEISEHVSEFMIHGSIATLDYSRGWSDFDTFVIVSRETALNGHALTALRSKLLKAYSFLTAVDPLQHHGFIVCTDIDLARYYEDTMPLTVLRKAKSYLGSRTLHLNPVKHIDRERKILASRAQFFRDAGETGVMKHHAYNGVYLESHYRNAENGLFQLKYLLGIGAIAPCYYQDAIGQPAYKKDAIAQVSPLLSESARSFLESTTHIRNEWPKRQEFPYEGNRIPEWFKEFVDPDYIVNLGNLLTELEHLAEDQV